MAEPKQVSKLLADATTAEKLPGSTSSARCVMVPRAQVATIHCPCAAKIAPKDFLRVPGKQTAPAVTGINWKPHLTLSQVTLPCPANLFLDMSS